jgi:hypothetical protein
MIKTSKIYRYGSGAVLVLGTCLTLLSSCKKNEYLNPQASTLITDVDAFSTAERIQAQVNGVYFRLKASDFLGSLYYVASDARAGDFISTNLNAAALSITYQLLTSTTTEEVQDIWEDGYQAINAANVFIDGMNKAGTAVVGEATAQNYIAEARLVRAVAYYYLLQLYAQPYANGAGSKPGLPLRLTANNNSGNYDLKRSTVKETYDQILEDLNFAEQNLPDAYSSAMLNTTRAHKNTAIALKTRVYLSMQDYANVITEANKIVSTAAPFQSPARVANALNPSIQAVFNGPYTTTESIFSMPFTANDAPGSSLGSYYLPGTGDGGSATSNGAGNYNLYPNGIPADPSWTAADDRRKFLVVGTKTQRLWLTKFKMASPYLDYAPVIRYSEVMLNLSEALARTNGGVDERAVALLAAVRNRSDKTTNYTAASFADNASFIAAILKERHIEFLGEGIRNADIMRLGQDIPAKPAHSVPAASPSSPNYIFPIPSDELILNKLIENN